MIRSLWPALALALVVGAQDKDPKKLDRTQIRKLIAAYIGAADADRPAILEQLQAADAIAKSDIRGWQDDIGSEIAKRSKYGGKSPATLQHPKVPMKYSLVGTPKPGAPLLIYLHGGGNDPGANDQGWRGALAEAPTMGLSVALVPRVFDDKSAVGWWEDSGIIAIDAMLDEFKRTYKIDTNRVYLGGYSMGAFGTAMVGPVLADRFAAIFAMAGGAGSFDVFENLRNTPFNIQIGDKDTPNGRLETTRKIRDILKKLHDQDKDGYAVEYKEYPGAGHGLPGRAHTDCGKWLQGFKRDPYPKTVVWKPYVSYRHYFYWLKLDKPTRGALIRARIVKGNRIEIEAGNVSGLTLLLNDSMVDLKKPVSVVVNGQEKFSGQVAYSLTALVESLAAKEDPEMVFTAKIVLP